jgi:protein kinase A
VFEMMVGVPPFYNPLGQTATLLEMITNKKVQFPPQNRVPMSPEAYDFITQLLDKNPKTRLGSKGGFKEVMTHPWMDKIDTQALL